MIGEGYYYGRWAPQDNRLALSWFRKSAKQRNAAAEYFLARMYAFGQGTSRNYTKAGTWLARSAGQGFIPAQIFMHNVTVEASKADSLKQ